MSQLNPKLAELLAVINQHPSKLEVGSVRRSLQQTADHYARPKVPLLLVKDTVFLHDNQAVSVRVYHPSPEQALPVVFNFHGGGHVSGDLETHDAFCRRVASHAQVVVVSVGYRRAPEFPYPAGLLDCLAAYQRKADLLQHLPVQLDRVYLMGDSAGGSLAASVVHRLGVEERKSLCGLILIYPSMDYTLSCDSVERMGEGYLLTKAKMAWYFEQYFSGELQDRLAASPLFFQDLQSFPSTYIALAEFDPLFDEGEQFARRLQLQGVGVTQETFSGMLHAFIQLEQLVPTDVDRLVLSISKFIQSQVASLPSGFS